jgi:hypothetical protein
VLVTNLQSRNDVDDLVADLLSPLAVLDDLFESTPLDQLHEEPRHSDGRVTGATPGKHRGSRDVAVLRNPRLSSDLAQELTALLVSPPRLVVRIGNFFREEGDLDDVRLSTDVATSEDTAMTDLVVSQELARLSKDVGNVTLKGVPVGEDIGLRTLRSPLFISRRTE